MPPSPSSPVPVAEAPPDSLFEKRLKNQVLCMVSLTTSYKGLLCVLGIVPVRFLNAFSTEPVLIEALILVAVLPDVRSAFEIALKS